MMQAEAHGHSGRQASRMGHMVRPVTITHRALPFLLLASRGFLSGPLEDADEALGTITYNGKAHGVEEG